MTFWSHSHASLSKCHVSREARHEAWHQGRKVEVAGVDRLTSLEPEAPVGGDRQPKHPGQGQAALIGDQIHDGEVKLLIREVPDQSRVFEHHLTVDVGDAVQVCGQLVRVVRLVPDHLAELHVPGLEVKLPPVIDVSAGVQGVVDRERHHTHVSLQVIPHV